jgi:hypothetical protein
MSLPGLTKQLKILLLLTVIVILISGGAVVAYLVHYSATSQRLCAQCHPEHAELWKQSKGHPAETTSCHECHSESPRIMPVGWNIVKHTRDQLVPSEYLADDELTAKRCLECHEDILDVGYQVKKKVINFTHRIHFGESLSCVDCHRTAGHEYMINGTNRPHVTECLDCHIKEFLGPPKNQKCLNCHDVMLAPGKTW